MNATEPYPRPRPFQRALIALAIGWAGLLAHTVLVFLAAVSAGHRREGNVFLAFLYLCVLVTALVLLAVGAGHLRTGRDDGRLYVTGAGVAPLPFLLIAAAMGLLWMLPRLAFAHREWTVHSMMKVFAVWSSLPAAVAAVGLLTGVLYLWQPGVTAYLRSPLNPGRMPHPKAPGEW